MRRSTDPEEDTWAEYVGSSQSDLNVKGQKCSLLVIWVLWVVKGTIKFKSCSLNCRNYAFSPFWIVRENEKHEEKKIRIEDRRFLQLSMLLIKSQHLMWIPILHEKRHWEIFECYHSAEVVACFWPMVYFPIKNINLFFFSIFMMLFLFSIFSFSVTTRQIPSHSYISVSLFHFHLSRCRNHFLFRCHYLEWASLYQWLFHLLSNIMYISHTLP